MKIVLQFILVYAGFFQLYASDDYKDLPSLVIDEKLICDLRLIANGSFAPLNGFMNESDYHSVLESERLANGILFPLPIVLPIPLEMKEMVLLSGKLLLKNEENRPLAIVLIEDIYSPSLGKECLSSFGTLDMNHPSVPRVLSRLGNSYVGGKIEPLPFLKQIDISEGISSPKETRSFFQNNNYKKVVAFQTRNPIHRAHLALIERCLAEAGSDALLFLHPVVGPTQTEDIPPSVRRKCYEALTPYLNKRGMYLGYLPLSMRMAGPKEALLHAIIRKNYGATHFIVGRDHAGPSSKDAYNQLFYAPYAAQEFVKLYEKELGLEILCSKEMVYVAETESYVPQDEVINKQTVFQISGSELRKQLQASLPLPEWFSFPEVEQILKDYYFAKQISSK